MSRAQANNAKVIIFDFDGTLADSSSIIRHVYNEMAQENGWPMVNEAEYQRLRGAGVTKVQKWVGIKSWQIPGYMREGLKRFRTHSKEVELFNGMPGLIKQLADSGKLIYVLSANNSKTIREVLARYGVADKTVILRRSALFSKDYAIRHLIAKHKYLQENVWMVGDEVRDIEAAKRAGVKSAAVTWGLQSNKILQATQPDAIATKPAELAALLLAVS